MLEALRHNGDVELAVGGGLVVVFLGRFVRRRAGGESEYHDQREKQCDQFFHSSILLKFYIKRFALNKHRSVTFSALLDAVGRVRSGDVQKYRADNDCAGQEGLPRSL